MDFSKQPSLIPSSVVPQKEMNVYNEKQNCATNCRHFLTNQSVNFGYALPNFFLPSFPFIICIIFFFWCVKLGRIMTFGKVREQPTSAPLWLNTPTTLTGTILLTARPRELRQRAKTTGTPCSWAVSVIFCRTSSIPPDRTRSTKLENSQIDTFFFVCFFPFITAYCRYIYS